jgi:hypothetical protein
MNHIYKRILVIDNQKFIKTTSNNWKLYLDIVSPERKVSETSLMNKCSIDYSLQYFWCDTCNKHNSNWGNGCINNIKLENVFKYSDLFLYEDGCKNYVTKKIL